MTRFQLLPRGTMLKREKVIVTVPQKRIDYIQIEMYFDIIQSRRFPSP